MSLRAAVFIFAVIAMGCGASQKSGAVKPGPAIATTAGVPFTPSGAPSSSTAIPVRPEPARAAESHNLAAGTAIPVETGDVADSSSTSEGTFVPVTVEEDVLGTNGRVAVPAGVRGALLVRATGRTGNISQMSLCLYTLLIDGHQYRLSNGLKDAATVVFSDDAVKGAGHRTIHLEAHSHLSFKLDMAVDLH